MTWWLWCVLGLLLLIAELSTPGGFYLMFFGFSAIAVGALSFLDVAGPIWLQVLLFSVFSIVLIATFRNRLAARLGRESTAEVDALVGERASAMESIAAGSTGLVQMRGTAWRARNAGATSIQSGEECEVERVDGLMLMVKGR